MTEQSILQEAEELIHGDRAKAYGHPSKNFNNIAKGWSVIFGKDITPEQVALAMIWVKVSRQLNTPKRDNLTDIAGYAGTIEMLAQGGEETEQQDTSEPVLRLGLQLSPTVLAHVGYEKLEGKYEGLIRYARIEPIGSALVYIDYIAEKKEYKIWTNNSADYKVIYTLTDLQSYVLELHDKLFRKPAANFIASHSLSVEDRIEWLRTKLHDETDPKHEDAKAFADKPLTAVRAALLGFNRVLNSVCDFIPACTCWQNNIVLSIPANGKPFLRSHNSVNICTVRDLLPYLRD